MKRTITSLGIALSALSNMANAGICTGKFTAESASVSQQVRTYRAVGQFAQAIELVRKSADAFDSMSATEGISAAVAKECSDYAVNYRLLQFQLVRELYRSGS